MSSIKHSAGFDIAQPVEQVFPLFSPEGEKAWVPGWDYENVMGTTVLSEDYVFLTRGHDHATSTAIWLVKRYVPETWLIQFYRVEPTDKIAVVTVQCSKTSERMTHVDVTYEYIALSDVGRKFIDSFAAKPYARFIDEWKNLLLQYFESAN